MFLPRIFGSSRYQVTEDRSTMIEHPHASQYVLMGSQEGAVSLNSSIRSRIHPDRILPGKSALRWPSVTNLEVWHCLGLKENCTQSFRPSHTDLQASYEVAANTSWSLALAFLEEKMDRRPRRSPLLASWMIGRRHDRLSQSSLWKGI